MKNLWENKFVRLPLSLAAVCLIFSSLLALTNFVTDPIIASMQEEKEKKAYEVLYGEGNISSREEVTFEATDNINSITKVVTTDNVEHYVYNLSTKNVISGDFNFLAGIKDGKVDAYSFIGVENNNNYGFAEFSNGKDRLVGYDGSNFSIVSGASNTSNGFKTALDAALAHYASLSTGA